jgi:thioredoxin-like negative regulator of GroEL
MNKSLRYFFCTCLLFQDLNVKALHREHEPINPDASPYEMLGLTPDAQSNEIRKAFRKLSLKFHPDKNPGDEIADANFKLINSAYDIIGDEAAREAFDSYAGQTFHSSWEYEQARRSGLVKGGGDLYKSGLVKSLDAATYKNMRQQVKNDGIVLLVKFFAGWCEHCQMLVPEIKKLASLLEGSVVVGAVNCEKNHRICDKNQIQSYPTLKLWSRKQNIKGEIYENEQNAIAIQRWIKRRMKTKYIIFRSQEEFDEKIKQNRTRPWLINWTTTAFYCPPCEGILGALRDISYSLHGLVNVGEVDCKRFEQMCADLEIWSFPDLKLYPKSSLSPTVQLNPDIMHMHMFPQVGMLHLFDQVSKVLLDHILIEQRQNDLPQRLKNVMKFRGDVERIDEIPHLMEVWKGKELQLWEFIVDEYELTEDMYEDEILPFIEELLTEESCIEQEGELSCHRSTNN